MSTLMTLLEDDDVGQQSNSEVPFGKNRLYKHQQSSIYPRRSTAIMSLAWPNPVLPPKRPFQFQVVREFLDLEKLKEDKDGKHVITLKSDCINPTPEAQDGESPAATLRRLIKDNGGPNNCKLVYLTRHGQSKHNIDAKEIGNAQYSAVCAHFAQDRDPALTLSGEREASELGRLISASGAASYALPSVVYCSSLKRTLQTAVICAARYMPADTPLALFPRDGLREFMGPGQLHMSDGRVSKKELVDTLSELQAIKPIAASLEDDFPDKDEGFNIAETYVSVDIRIEQELVKVFDETSNDPSGAVHIVSHNRAIQSTMRLLGYTADESNYRVFDFENAATVALLISRVPRSDPQQKEQQLSDTALQRREKKQIHEAYYADVNSGFEKIRIDCAQGRSDKWRPWLEKLEAEVENGIPNKVIEWRLELLRRAMSGRFEYGDFASGESDRNGVAVSATTKT
ncbi:hypothetical protein ACHAQH_006702 [Verticillium albo-atrum]